MVPSLTGGGEIRLPNKAALVHVSKGSSKHLSVTYIMCLARIYYILLPGSDFRVLTSEAELLKITWASLTDEKERELFLSENAAQRDAIDSVSGSSNSLFRFASPA